MKIGAIADLHGRLPVLHQPVDVLCIAGDIAPDFPFSVTQFDPDIARVRQMEWLTFDYAEWEKTIPAKRILVTPGNHDWWNRMPENCRSEVLIDSAVEVDGLEFYGTPWVAPCGDWNYMATRENRKRAFADIPRRTDVLIAHAPAHMVMDQTYGGDHAGCPELRSAIYDKKPRHVFFGHIHEGRRRGLDSKLGESLMHHVSMWGESSPRVFDIEYRG